MANLDYRNYKTPFYEIEVTDASGKRRVKLPHHILRLVNSVEIFETYQAGEFSTLKVVFIEGSREPASTNVSSGTKGLFKIPNPKVQDQGSGSDLDISGSINNRPGIVTDLRFSGTAGITFLSEDERKTGKIDRSPLESIVGKDVSRIYQNEVEAPLFLFHERNRIIVTWGYKENPKTVRKVAGYIQLVSVSFPEGEQIRTEITAQDTGSIMDQVAPVKAKTYALESKADGFTQLTDMKVEDIVTNLGTKASLKVVLSKGIPNNVLDNKRVKIWAAGESFHQFLTRMAKNSNCYYKIVTSTDGGPDTLVFIGKTDFNSRTLNLDPALFTYKGANSVLKSVDIRCDFGITGTNSQVGVDNKGQLTSDTSSHGSEQVALFKTSSDAKAKTQEAVDHNPANSGNRVPAATSIVQNELGGKYTGKAVNQPSEDPSYSKNSASIKASEVTNNFALVNFTAIGVPQLTPGTIQLSNIGLRYSGKYELIGVTHTINSSGYLVTCSAKAGALSTGGVVLPDAKKGEDKGLEQEAVKLFNENDTRVDGSPIRDALEKAVGIK